MLLASDYFAFDLRQSFCGAVKVMSGVDPNVHPV